jgi:phage tail sheath protein FI
MGTNASAEIEERVRAALVRGLAWTVSEANTERLWALARETASTLLLGYWRNGELAGAREEEAYFVRCGRDTMTQQDIDNGRLIVEVGIATVAPAEFAIIRLEQIVGGGRPKRWPLPRPAWLRLGRR